MRQPTFNVEPFPPPHVKFTVRVPADWTAADVVNEVQRWSRTCTVERTTTSGNFNRHHVAVGLEADEDPEKIKSSIRDDFRKSVVKETRRKEAADKRNRIKAKRY